MQGDTQENKPTHRFNFSEWIHTNDSIWLVINEQAQEVNGVLWWWILRNNERFGIDVGLQFKDYAL